MAIDYDEPAHRWRSNAKHFWPNALWPRLGLPVWGCTRLRVCVLWLRLWLNWDIGQLPRIAATDTRQWGEGGGGELAEMRGTLATDNFRCTQIGNWSSSAEQQSCNSAADYLGPVPANALANVINTNIIIFG